MPRRKVLPVLLGLGLLLAMPAVAAGIGHVVICSEALGADGGACPVYASHPARIEAGADGRTVYIKLRWAHWGRSQATSKGLLREDAGPAGHPEYSYSKATMTASRIRSCGGHRAYTKLVIRAAGHTGHFDGCGLI
jgi:hypothetical protein